MTEASGAGDAAKPEPWEARLPEWQRRVNRFCENWIFAFIVAFGIRHFALEAFRIPTASMEPVMWGDAAFTRSDYVIVDKITQRFRDPRRWEVTVFQFPHPEIEVRGDAVSAIAEDGRRLDGILRPQMYRNFVKRAVALPGDTFYFAHGELFLKGEDGAFHVARKPREVQESVWLPIYRHGAQREPQWYVPWTAGADASVENRRLAGLRFAVAPGDGGAVAFDQPIMNLYFKPGPVYAQYRLGEGAGVVQASLTAPLFTLDGRLGNVWKMDEWWLRRVTTRDLDNPMHGADLNLVMRERVGDARIMGRIAALEGQVALRIRQGQQRWHDLRLTGARWSVVSGDDAGQRVVAEGEGRPTAFSFAVVDQQLVAELDGREVARSDLAESDPQAEPVRIEWRGQGTIQVEDLGIDRDLHYTATGFLLPEQLALVTPEGTRDLGSREEWMKADQMRQQPTLAAEGAKIQRHMVDVRAQMLGREPVGSAQWKRVGWSPGTAITVPDGAYLLLGDNSPFSWDSRMWGYVPEANLRGRVLVRVRARVVNGIPLPFSDWAVVK